MNVLYQSAFLKALGWALLDSFWQMGILWLVFVLLTHNGKKFKPTQRHSLALLSLAGGALWFLLTLIFHFNLIHVETKFPAEGISGVYTNALVTDPSITSFFTFIEPVFPVLSVAYLFSLIYLFIRLYNQYYLTQKLFFTGKFKVKPELRIFLQTIATQMGIKKDVRIWLSDLVDTPLTIGFWKPVILLPVAVINHLSFQQAEAIILHELNHIKRNDYFINLLVSCIEIILFFNPFVRILTHIIKNERENCCDDMVLQYRYNAGQYANALLLLEKNRVANPSLAMNATGRSKKLLLKRVERILNKKSTGTFLSQKLVAYVLCALLIGLIGLYNPGKVILKTIDTVQNTAAHSHEGQLSFSASEIIKDEPLEKPVSTTKNKNSNKAAGHQVENNVKADHLLEESEEWILDADPENPDVETPPSLISYAGTETELREYSIRENPIYSQPAYSGEIHPYIPSTSFSYQLIDDTALPKKYIPTHVEVKANEAMASALKALEGIDWQKLEKEMSDAGKKLDVIKLQQELKKAMSDVDWKKIHEEMQSSLMMEENELLKENPALHLELKKIQQNRNAKLAEKEKIYNSILEERLCEEKTKETKSYKKPVAKTKKIVHI